MCLGLLVVGALAIRDADRRHQRDPHRVGADGREHVPYAGVVNAFRALPTRSVRAEGEDDSINLIDSIGQTLGLGHVSDDDLCCRGQHACCLRPITNQCSGPEARSD